MKRLAIGLTAALAAFASFAEPQATRTYVNAKIAIAKGEAANDAEAKANAAKTAAVAEAKGYTDEKTAGKVSAEELAAATNAVKSAAVADAGTAADAKIAAATADLAKKSEIPDVSDLAKKSEIPDVSDLAKKSDLDAKADDDAVVKLAGAQTISGAKTFTSAVKIPLAPAANNDAASKQYVDNKATATLTSAASDAADKYQPKGNYLTQHQSLAEYDKASVVEGKISTAVASAKALADETYQPKGSYQTTAQMQNYSTTAQMNSAISAAASGKADDSAVVKLSGNQTVAGNKTFTGAVSISATPTADTHAATKKYVDDGNSSTLASAKVYVDNQVGYGQPYKLMQLTSGITLEDHHTYYVTITGNMTITLPKADDTHTTSRIISLYIECNGETAPTITVNKNGNTIVIQPTDYGGPSEEEDYFQPKPQGKTMINLIELKPNCYLAQQVYLKDWEF